MTLDPRNIESLKEFFEENKGLTMPLLAILANRSIWTILEWKRKCGMIKKKVRKPKPKLPVPENWDNKEWLEKAYQTMGFGAIGHLVGKHRIDIYNKFKKYNIPTKTYAERVGSSNPCCDEGWLYYYYSDREDYLKWCEKQRVEPCPNGGQRLTLNQCAKLADASHQTIAGWLTLFKMKQRTVAESFLGISTAGKLSDSERRQFRDKYFEEYRAGTINMVLGPQRFSNGKRLDRTKTVSQRFNKHIRGTSKRPQS